MFVPSISLLSLFLALASTPISNAQDLPSNITSLTGTWTTGSGAVVTGPEFADPMNNGRPFIYPANTGIAYSFTDDGYFEEAQYRYLPNASDPHCARAMLIWQHGRYTIHANNSITIDPSPFLSDGRILIQNRCTAQSEFLTYYNQWEIYNGWYIEIDVHHGAYMLQLERFDGSFMPRLYLTVRPPTMLPTAYLTLIANGTQQAVGGTAMDGTGRMGKRRIVDLSEVQEE